MTRARLVVAIALVGSVAIVATFAGMAGARAATTIQVGDDFFAPTSKTVKAGTKVRFKWIGEDKHNVVKKRGPGGDFASGSTDAPGVNFAKKFKRKGKYRIICTLHDDMKMRLKVD